MLPPIDGRLRTRCCSCQHEFYIGMSLAMRFGMNTGHCTCPQCKRFLHVEILEGDEAWTEDFGAFSKQDLARLRYVKHAPAPFVEDDTKTHREREKAAGDAQFFAMRRPPFQFVTTSFWGAGPE